MDAFVEFFEQMPLWQRLAWLLGCLFFAWLLEFSFPLFKFDYRKWKHDGVNLVFLLFTLAINVIFSIITLAAFEWNQQIQFGLLYQVQVPLWAQLIISLMALDFIAQYVIHYLLHQFKWMWKLHMVHHSDSKVDASTGTRFHPGDYVLREIFALLTIVFIGAPFAFYMFYRICTIFFTYITHANISVPLWLDKTFSLIFITPNVHKFHHHFERPWTNTNFGNIFSLWDRIFGTFVYDDLRKIKYGLDVLDEKFDEDIMYQLKIPLDKTIKTDY